MSELDNLVKPGTVAAIRTAGLHRVVGDMAGVGDLDMRKVAGLIGARAFARRKTARLVIGGILAMAAVRGERLSPVAEERIRGIASPAGSSR